MAKKNHIAASIVTGWRPTVPGTQDVYAPKVETCMGIPRHNGNLPHQNGVSQNGHNGVEQACMDLATELVHTAAAASSGDHGHKEEHDHGHEEDHGQGHKEERSHNHEQEHGETSSEEGHTITNRPHAAKHGSESSAHTTGHN
jgi:TATA-binding protein-associated factor Taf7